MRPLFVTAFPLLILALAPPAFAQEDTPSRPPAWGPTHPVAIGGRIPVRLGDGYVMGGIGGHLRLRPFDRVRLELFFDNFVGEDAHAMRHDHEVGTTLQIAVIRTDRVIVYPMLGACAMLAMLSPHSETPSVSDVRFGVHVGAGVEVALGRGFSLALQLETVGYVGHAMTAYDWTANVSRDLSISFVGQSELALNYWF